MEDVEARGSRIEIPAMTVASPALNPTTCRGGQKMKTVKIFFCLKTDFKMTAANRALNPTTFHRVQGFDLRVEG